MGHLGCHAPDGCRRHAGDLLGHVGRILVGHVTLGQQLEHRPALAPVRQVEAARQRRRHVDTQRRCYGVGGAIEAQRVVVVVARDQAVFGVARCIDHQPRRVGVTHHEFQIDFLRLEQFMHHRQHQRAVGAGTHADPFVGDRGIGGLDRIDGDVFGAARLELGQARLDRVAVVIFGDAEHDEIFGVVPIGLAEFPEAAADRIDAGRGHIDRTEAAMGCVIGRAELLRPPTGQGLALIAAGEERELTRILVADFAQPQGRQLQRLFPLDFLEIARAAFAHPQQRLGQPRRRIVVHDAGRALAAQHALIDRMGLVALDIADAPILEMHANAATAGAHVTSGGLNLVGDLRRQVFDRLRCHALLFSSDLNNRLAVAPCVIAATIGKSR